MKELGPSFEPEKFESSIYKFWVNQDCFSPKADPERGDAQNAYCIVIPPPNVTGVLHIGHALGLTMEDILIRWRRMSGDETLWIPGTDHAGIATQTQVEKAIAKEGKGPSGRPLTRHDLGREKFLERVWKWKQDHGSVIGQQMRRMGASLDWSRERFTMDEGCSRAVREVFVSLYEQNLIYRGDRIINWCPRCQTALSDLEVNPTPRTGSLWRIRYPIIRPGGGKAGHLVIATTRPETLLGDTAVAVHPEDPRYSELGGSTVRVPLIERDVPIIRDEYVDREFGTGALKVTPAHDFNDYELGKKHSLNVISVMGRDGRMSTEAGPYAGMKFSEARSKVVADLESEGLLEGIEPYSNQVGLCQRCDNVAEPLISKQWFVQIEPLAQKAIAAVESGEIQFTPKHWEKTYFEWMRNIRDWCISRQLWWGHQIPAWYCQYCGATTVNRVDPSECISCGSREIKRDEDVLDTWFSSALWPFSTLGWPEKADALNRFYPTAVLETGYDIIFFWVARMIMMGCHFMGQVPFRKVYLHSMVRDEKGDKMSKTKGNVIDPLEVIDKHGADPLRFTLAILSGHGRDVKLSLDRIEGYRAFCNKLWNAVKFFHFQTGGKFDLAQSVAWVEEKTQNGTATLSLDSRWLLSRFENAKQIVYRGLSEFELSDSAQAIYDFVWHELCDWAIELSKLGFQNPDTREETKNIMAYVLDQTLKLMHPFTPFLTEELWQSLSQGDQVLMLQAYPKLASQFNDSAAEVDFAPTISLIKSVRRFRGENNLSPKREITCFVKVTGEKEDIRFLQRDAEKIKKLARVENIIVGPVSTSKFLGVIPIPEIGVELSVPLEGLIDIDEELQRIEKEIGRCTEDLSFVDAKLARPSFIEKAPPALVAAEKEKRDAFQARIDQLGISKGKLQSLKDAGKP